jgi:hypothetical protein
MPDRPTFPKMYGFKTAKERPLLLLGHNTLRGQKLKSYFVCHAENPHALKT